MAINRVDYGDNTLIDLTQDTATENDVLEGAVFHARNGEQVQGALRVGFIKKTYEEWQTMSEEERNKGAYYVPDYPVQYTTAELLAMISDLEARVEALERK